MSSFELPSYLLHAELAALTSSLYSAIDARDQFRNERDRARDDVQRLNAELSRRKREGVFSAEYVNMRVAEAKESDRKYRERGWEKAIEVSRELDKVSRELDNSKKELKELREKLRKVHAESAPEAKPPTYRTDKLTGKPYPTYRRPGVYADPDPWRNANKVW